MGLLTWEIRRNDVMCGTDSRGGGRGGAAATGIPATLLPRAGGGREEEEERENGEKKRGHFLEHVFFFGPEEEGVKKRQRGRNKKPLVFFSAMKQYCFPLCRNKRVLKRRKKVFFLGCRCGLNVGLPTNAFRIVSAQACM